MDNDELLTGVIERLDNSIKLTEDNNNRLNSLSNNIGKLTTIMTGVSTSLEKQVDLIEKRRIIDERLEQEDKEQQQQIIKDKNSNHGLFGGGGSLLSSVFYGVTGLTLGSVLTFAKGLGALAILITMPIWKKFLEQGGEHIGDQAGKVLNALGMLSKIPVEPKKGSDEQWEKDTTFTIGTIPFERSGKTGYLFRKVIPKEYWKLFPNLDYEQTEKEKEHNKPIITERESELKEKTETDIKETKNFLNFAGWYWAKQIGDVKDKLVKNIEDFIDWNWTISEKKKQQAEITKLQELYTKYADENKEYQKSLLAESKKNQTNISNVGNESQIFKKAFIEAFNQSILKELVDKLDKLVTSWMGFNNLNQGTANSSVDIPDATKFKNSEKNDTISY